MRTSWYYLHLLLQQLERLDYYSKLNILNKWLIFIGLKILALLKIAADMLLDSSVIGSTARGNPDTCPHKQQER